MRISDQINYNWFEVDYDPDNDRFSVAYTDDENVRSPVVIWGIEVGTLEDILVNLPNPVHLSELDKVTLRENISNNKSRATRQRAMVALVEIAAQNQREDETEERL